MKRLYAIVDVETTGRRPAQDRITELAIVLYDGKQVVDRFESLINPERTIPGNIEKLTGVTQEMVAGAPKFAAVAEKVLELTQDAVFVAHNAPFDYNFLREEFSRLGKRFSRKQLCTVVLSRKVFPGLRSYSLDKLIDHLNLKKRPRHRAMGDVLTTVELLEKILAKKDGLKQVENLINLGLTESMLPINLSIKDIHELPEKCGIYYLYDAGGRVLYIGKGSNIKKLVAKQFADAMQRRRSWRQRVYKLNYELTGSKLAAQLLANIEIKRLRPSYNRLQRLRRFPYVIYTFLDAKGYRRFQIAKVDAEQRKKLDVLTEYPSFEAAQARLRDLRRNYNLCVRLLKPNARTGACYYFRRQQCLGACTDLEAPETYNQRAEKAKESLKTVFPEDFVIIDRGRTPNEQFVLMVKNGQYQGHAFIHKKTDGEERSSLTGSTSRPAKPSETIRLIQRYLSKAPTGTKVVRF